MNNIFEKKENKVIETIEMNNVQSFNTAMGLTLAHANGDEDGPDDINEFMEMTFQELIDFVPEEIKLMKMRDICDAVIEVQKGNFDTSEKVGKFLKDRGYDLD